MKIVVLGAGVVGVTTAYELTKDGHEVVLVERHDKAAVETSFGNAGLYSPSDSYAWASPSALKMAIRSLYKPDLGIKYNIRLDPRLWLWSLKFLAQCTHAAAYRNTLRKLRLTIYSRQCLNRVVGETGIDYDGRSHGIVFYFRSREGLKATEQHMSILRDHGLELETVDVDRIRELEPATVNLPDIAGGIYSPSCQTGDSHKFSNRLVEWSVKHKRLNWMCSTKILSLQSDHDRIGKAVIDKGDIDADLFVLAAGSESVYLAESVGLRLPIYPVKGFSITAPLLEPETGPNGGLVDEDRLIGMSTLGNRIRAASSAIFNGFDYSHKPEDFRSIIETTRKLFPDAIDYDAAIHWTGLRPMTPSSFPIIGRSSYKNLYLNVGHGHVGWSMSCGSAAILRDLIAGRTPEIDVNGLVTS